MYGDIEVTFVNVVQFSSDYLMRKFTLEKSSANSSTASNPITVYQFQYLAWSDHGVPDNVQNTVSFIEHVNKLYKEINSNKPITVHCSAGIGRTGAVIEIDMIIDKIKTLGIQCDVDIYKSVSYLRSQRSGMIQTEKQYQYLYTTINYFIEMLTQLHNNRNINRTQRIITKNNNSHKVLGSDRHDSNQSQNPQPVYQN